MFHPAAVQALRPKAGSWMYLRFNCDELTVDEISAGQYLAFKEHLVEGEGRQQQHARHSSRLL